jgi:serine/threonine protein kinase
MSKRIRCTEINTTNNRHCKRKIRLKSHSLKGKEEDDDNDSRGSVALEQFHMCKQHRQKRLKTILLPVSMPPLEYLAIENLSVAMIGSGGYSRVHSLSIKGVKHAVKCTKLNGPKKLACVEAELQICDHVAAQITRCPYIIEWKGWWLDYKNEMCYSLMEYAKHGDLFDYRETKDKNDTLERRMKWCHQIAQALQYLHEECGVIFRDLKQENILLTNDFKEAKLCDFGLSAFVFDQEELKRGVGTPVYFAPETFDSSALKNEKIDSWAFGILLYEMIHNKVPFEKTIEKEPSLEVIRRFVTSHKPPLLRKFELAKKMCASPTEYEQWMCLIDACLEPDHRVRLTMHDIISCMEALLEQKVANPRNALESLFQTSTIPDRRKTETI